MEYVYEKKEKNKRAKAAIIAALVFSLAIFGTGVAVFVSGFVVGDVAVVNVTVLARGAALSITAVSIVNDVGIDIGNMTTQMTTMFITLIGIMIPLIIIMAYLGIFQDFLAAIGRAFGGLFGRH